MECPHCGPRVPARATACPECGSVPRYAASRLLGMVGGEHETVDHEAVDLPDAYDPDRWEREISRDQARRTRLVVVAATVAFLFICVAVGVWRGR